MYHHSKLLWVDYSYATTTCVMNDNRKHRRIIAGPADDRKGIIFAHLMVFDRMSQSRFDTRNHKLIFTPSRPLKTLSRTHFQLQLHPLYIQSLPLHASHSNRIIHRIPLHPRIKLNRKHHKRHILLDRPNRLQRRRLEHHTLRIPIPLIAIRHASLL
jgi:hypothetical protein